MNNKHEFSPGGTMDGRFDESDICCQCGESPDHIDHKDEDGNSYIDTDSVIDRMDARGNVRPRTS